jgi:3-(3-hydroxy-phenyl)propionate hydroxylase
MTGSEIHHDESGPERVPCDVLVVGYGPVGMTCAALLAHYGLDVIAIDRHPERYLWHRAGHLDGEAMRIFQRLQVAEAVELVAQPLVSMQMIGADGEVLGQVESGQSGSGWRSDYTAYQPDYERAIDARARELGATALMATRAEAITQDRDGVRTVVRPVDENAQPYVIESRFLIGADGANSFARSAVGAERLDLGFKAVPHLVVDFEYADPDCDLPELPDAVQVLDIERPNMGGRWGARRHSRFEFAARDGESRTQLESEANCWELIGRWGLTPEHGKIVRHTVFEFESSLAAPWRAGRVLLMGDAAHTMPPHLGQGMLSGLRDAENLAWKLAAVLEGRADERLLDTYQTEREPHVRRLIALSSALGSTILETDPDRARARDEALRSGRGPAAGFPRIPDGLVRRPGAAGGLEAPGADGRPGLQARVALGTRVARLDDLLPRRGWRIVSRHPVPETLFTDVQRALLDSLEMRFVHVSRGASGESSFWDIDAEFDRWYRGTGRKVFLERPDHYVYATAERIEDLPALIDELGADLAAHGWNTTTIPGGGA